MFFLLVALKVGYSTEKNLAQLSFSWDKIVCSSDHWFEKRYFRSLQNKSECPSNKRKKICLTSNMFSCYQKYIAIYLEDGIIVFNLRIRRFPQYLSQTINPNYQIREVSCKLDIDKLGTCLL